MAERVCPVWIGYILSCPIRRFFENPKKILGDYIKPGMTVLDVGCAMGFFSLPLARMVGTEGKVIAVDLQPGMIRALKRRASRAGLSNCIEARICTENSLGIADLHAMVDFALGFHVMHEVPDVPRLMREVYASLKSEAGFYIIEPKGHSTAENFAATEQAAVNAGFRIIDHPKFRRDRAVLLAKN